MHKKLTMIKTVNYLLLGLSNVIFVLGILNSFGVIYVFVGGGSFAESAAYLAPVLSLCAMSAMVSDLQKRKSLVLWCFIVVSGLASVAGCIFLFVQTNLQVEVALQLLSVALLFVSVTFTLLSARYKEKK